MSESIPFNRPFIAGKELFYIAQAVTRGKISGDGHFTENCSRFLEQHYQIPKVLMTPSCTAALEMAAMLGRLGPGDEVILPSYTFVSTANAVVRLGAHPVFVDVRPDTLNLDERLIEAAVTPRTRAIVPVHYAGVACEMDEIMQIAARHDLLVIEDAAQGVNAFYRGRALGSIGHLGCYSFHETKNYVCGEGGALCINDRTHIERAEILRDKGTNRKQFFRGQVDKYTWVDVGSSYVPSEIACAFLYGQLEMAEAISRRREEVYNAYLEGLAPLAEEGLLQLPTVPAHCRLNYHLFYILLPDGEIRNALLEQLAQQKINAVFHYIPLHSSPMGQAYGYRAEDLPVTQSVSNRLLRLPLYFDLSAADQQRVIAETQRILRSIVGETSRISLLVRRDAAPMSPSTNNRLSIFAAPPADTSEVIRLVPAPAAAPSQPQRADKRVAIVQSNYIPWKGYFDLIRAADEFILLDTVQYTRRDWRNRNKIKTSQGTAWLTIPVKVKGLYHQRICDTEIDGAEWAEKHWSSFCAHYGRAPWFSRYREQFEPLYRREQPRLLSEINRAFMQAICDALEIATPIKLDSDYDVVAGKNERLLELCLQAGATEYLSGPAARGYLDERLFAEHGIQVLFADYSDYPTYEQLFPPFEHAVTALDLLFNAGPAAAHYLKNVASAPTGATMPKAA